MAGKTASEQTVDTPPIKQDAPPIKQLTPVANVTKTKEPTPTPQELAIPQQPRSIETTSQVSSNDEAPEPSEANSHDEPPHPPLQPPRQQTPQELNPILAKKHWKDDAEEASNADASSEFFDLAEESSDYYGLYVDD